MPLTDRPEFHAWLGRHAERDVGRPTQPQSECSRCGAAVDSELSPHECLVCLVEQFGTDTAEQWLAETLAGLIRAAADPVVLAQVLAEVVPFTRDVLDYRLPAA